MLRQFGIRLIHVGILSAVIVLYTGGAAFSADATEESFNAVELNPRDHHKQISMSVNARALQGHYRRFDLDDTLSEKILARYIDGLDGNKLYLLQSDVANFEAYSTELDNRLRIGDVAPAFEIFRVYQERVAERIDYALDLLSQEPDFTVNESFLFDRREIPWAASEAELAEVWRQRVKNDALSLMLADKTWDEAAELLSKRYKRVRKRVYQVKPDDVFETFMNAYTGTLDPHSSYFSPRNSEEYRIQMSLSYEGIGASLQVEDEYVKVMSIIPGGPAAILGEPKPSDRITAVGQGEDGEMLDVVGWRLDDVVQLIRGPGNTTVRLQILPAGTAPGSPENVISLKRGKVNLEAQAAKSEILEVPNDAEPLKIGVIDVPSFYQDYDARARNEKNYRSTTADVSVLISELTAQGVDALIIDLRGNGGGHLIEARHLTGLFIDGPVVQLRTNHGRDVHVLPDEKRGVVYDGPLVVLVDRLSASASEIFAGAIQDYGRGIVVGQQTFGKGSVQNLYPLGGTLIQRLARKGNTDFGQLTLTIGKYYRVTGESTQHRGVVPDILLPSTVDDESVGESTHETALQWDQIQPASDFATDSPLDESIVALATRHTKRAATDPDFAYWRDLVATYEEIRSRKSVSLNIEQRREDREAIQQNRLTLENERRAAHGLEPLSDLEELESTEAPDYMLTEAAAIAADDALLRPPATTASTKTSKDVSPN